MNNNIPTAEEYVRYEDHRNYHDFNKAVFTGKQLKEFMIGFARHHVKAALEAAFKEGKINPNYSSPYDDPEDRRDTINKDSILNAYNLDNIK